MVRFGQKYSALVTRKWRPAVVSSPVRQFNHDRVLEILRRQGLLSRKELAERTGLSRSTVAAVLGDLLASGMVEFAAPPGIR
jgi:predicted ArsR family transcriptional regulator